jgi:capsular polysaccharide biosynthesis protein
MLVKGQSIVSSETYAPIMGSVHRTQAEIVKSYPVLKRAAIALNLEKRPLDYEKNYCSYLKNLYIDFLIRKTEEKFQTFPPEKQEEMRLDSAIDDLRERITVRMMPGTDIFIINVKAYTSEEAIETANVISRSYTMFDQIQQLAEVTMKYGEFHPTVIQLKDNINNATANLSGKPLPDIEAIGTASVKIIEQATSDYLPVSTQKESFWQFSLLMSLGVSFGLAVIKGLLDEQLKLLRILLIILMFPVSVQYQKKGGGINT